VGKLETAWTFDTNDWSDGKDLPSRSSFEATPLVIDGVMYVTTAWSKVLALDAVSGRQLWAYDPKVPGDAAEFIPLPE
jgi:alcohol dehydrogenase (cytochrome c)/quinohemoprotein ethanol dehydrogenase